VVVQKILSVLGALSSAARTGLATALARTKGMLQDRDVKTFVLFTLAFSNFITQVVAAVTQTDQNKALASLEALGITLGNSLSQIIVGLRTVTTDGTGIISFITAIATILFGLSTIYYWYRGNWWFIDTIAETNIRLTDHIYITLVLVLAILAYGGEVQFFELVDLTKTAGEQVANTTDTSNAVETVKEAEETGRNILQFIP
jgi:hypothetical protein